MGHSMKANVVVGGARRRRLATRAPVCSWVLTRERKRRVRAVLTSVTTPVNNGIIGDVVGIAVRWKLDEGCNSHVWGKKKLSHGLRRRSIVVVPLTIEKENENPYRVCVLGLWKLRLLVSHSKMTKQGSKTKRVVNWIFISF